MVLTGALSVSSHAQDWGASPDDGLSVLGDWVITDDSIYQATIQMTTPDLNRIFYRGAGKLANYTVSAQIKLLENGHDADAGYFAKYGFYPAYKDLENFVWVFMHPDPSEDFISVVAMVNGEWTRVWEVFAAGSMNTNYGIYNEFKIDKAGDLFTVYVNNEEKANFTAAIDSAWVGYCSDAIRASYKNFSLIDSDAVGLSEIQKQSEILVYPNPAVNALQFSSPIMIDNIDFYSITGQKVKSMSINDLNYTIDVQDLNHGIYIVKIETAEDLFIKKIQVQ